MACQAGWAGTGVCRRAAQRSDLTSAWPAEWKASSIHSVSVPWQVPSSCSSANPHPLRPQPSTSLDINTRAFSMSWNQRRETFHFIFGCEIPCFIPDRCDSPI